MTRRMQDGSAGDADYGTIAGSYSTYRQAEPRIAALIERALAGARTMVNVGAGAGSYESTALDVTAVEPSASMRAQRPSHLPEAIDAVAEHLPLASPVPPGASSHRNGPRSTSSGCARTWAQGFGTSGTATCAGSLI